MPNVKAHRKITVLAQISTFPSIILVDSVQKLAFFGAFQAGIGLTYLVNPDNDLVQRLGEVGNILGYGDYEREMPHRFGGYGSQWRRNWKVALLGSHAPISGTLIRLLPILVPLSLLLILLGGTKFLFLLVPFLLGTCWSDLWHIVIDVMWSKTKKGVRSVLN